LELKSKPLDALEEYLKAFRTLPSILDYTDAYIQIIDDIINSYRKLGHLKEANELSGLSNELREYTRASGVFEDFRKKEKIASATSKIKNVIDSMQNIRENIYFINGLYIDFNERITKKDDRTIKLTRDQWKILECLWRKKGQVCARNELRVAIGWSSDISTRTVDEQIYKMRKKIGPEHILSNRGEGYSLLMPN
jgi:hypothetical protein